MIEYRSISKTFADGTEAVNDFSLLTLPAALLLWASSDVRRILFGKVQRRAAEMMSRIVTVLTIWKDFYH